MAGLLVLGASGLIGRAVVAEARRMGISPITGVGRSASRVEGTDAWHAMDLSSANAASFSEVLDSTRPAAVVNCAGRTQGELVPLVASNVMTVGVLLDALARSSAMPRLVHVGSAAEYSPTAPGVDTREDDPTEPRMPYGITKGAATRLIEASLLEEKVDAVVARVFNPLGADMPEASMPGRAARLLWDAARSGRDSVAMGPLDGFRDFIDTRDIAAALIQLAQVEQPAHRIFNVANGVAHQARDIVGQIGAAIGFAGEVIETAPASPRSGGIAWQRADISRLTALGWRAKYEPHASISALVASLDPSGMAARSDERTDR